MSLRPNPRFTVTAARAAEFSAEVPFSEALIKLWEQGRDRKVEALSTVTISMFKARDAFPMVNTVNAVAGATMTIRLAGGYETRDGGAFELEFSGPPLRRATGARVPPAAVRGRPRIDDRGRVPAGVHGRTAAGTATRLSSSPTN